MKMKFELQWTFKGKLIKSDESKYTINGESNKAGNKSSSSLTITKMNSMDDGIYTCQANVKIGKQQKETKSKFSKSIDISGILFFVVICNATFELKMFFLLILFLELTQLVYI